MITPLPDDFPSKHLLVDAQLGSVEQLQASSDAEIGAIKGIGVAALRRIREALALLTGTPVREADPEPETLTPVVPAVASVRVKIEVPLLYHLGRWHARGDTLTMPDWQAATLRQRGAVSY